MIPSWDLVIGIFLAIGIGYAFLLGREKILTTIVSTYIGFVIATIWGDAFTKFLSMIPQDTVQNNATSFTVKVGLFAIFTILLTLKGGYGAKPSGAKSLIEMGATGLLGLLNGTFAIASVLSFATEKSISTIATASKIATYAQNYYTWWIVLPALVILGLSFLTPPPPQD